MVPVEPDVNRSIEERATPWPGGCYPQRRASRRASVGSNRFGDAAHQTLCAEHNSLNPSCYFASIALDSPDRVATGFVRRSCFSLYLVCRTRLDRDFRTSGWIRVTRGRVV